MCLICGTCEVAFCEKCTSMSRVVDVFTCPQCLRDSPNSIAIGNEGAASRPANTIILNASGAAFHPVNTNAFYAKPVLRISPGHSTFYEYRTVMYHPTTYELVYVEARTIGDA